jgi:hypothetical protein
MLIGSSKDAHIVLIHSGRPDRRFGTLFLDTIKMGQDLASITHPCHLLHGWSHGGVGGLWGSATPKARFFGKCNVVVTILTNNEENPRS